MVGYEITRDKLLIMTLKIKQPCTSQHNIAICLEVQSLNINRLLHVTNKLSHVITQECEAAELQDFDGATPTIFQSIQQT